MQILLDKDLLLNDIQYICTPFIYTGQGITIIGCIKKTFKNGTRIERIVQKAIIKKGFSKNTWNKGKLQNRYRARWAKGKTDIGLDEHRATHT